MGQRINSKGLRLAVNQQWSTQISVVSNNTRKIIDLRFHILKVNQLLKKKGFKMVDAYVLNYNNQLIFFILIQKYEIIQKKSIQRPNFFFRHYKNTKISILKKKKDSSFFILSKKKFFYLTKYHKSYLNFLSLNFFVSNLLNKKTLLFFYPIQSLNFINSSLVKNFLLTIKQKFKRYTRFFYFVKAMRLILISLFFNQPIILSQTISKLLQINKKHSFILKFVENILQFLLARWINLLLIGLKLQISGKLNGRHRKQTKKIQLGLNPLQTLSININYSLTTSHTKFGSFGVGVWFIKA